MIFYKLLLNSGISIPENAITYTAPSKLDIPKNTSGISKHSFSKGVGIIIPTTSTLPSVFAGTNVTSIGVPANITSVPNECFKGCSELQYFTGPYATEDGAMFIIDNKIMGVASQSGEEFTIPTSVTSIENYAFEGCSGTLKILCDSVPGGASESSCPVKNGWLYGTNFSKIDLASPTISVGSYAFFGMTSLKEVIISNPPILSLNMGEGAFGNCTGLTSVDIPYAVSLEISGAFYGCTNIKEFTGVYATEDGKYVISKGKLQAVVMADIHVIPESVTVIGRSLFRNDVMSEVTLPEGLETIAAYAFNNSKIGSINIPSTLKTINSSAFGSVDVVNIVSMDQWLQMSLNTSGLISSKTNVLYNGSTVTHITIPEGTTTIGECKFSNFKDLISVDMPTTVTVVEKYAFNNCSKLKQLELPNTVTSIGESAFYDCSSWIADLVFNKYVYIYYMAFSGCKSLKTVQFKSTQYIESYVFSGCTGLKKVSFLGGITPSYRGSDIFKGVTGEIEVDVLVGNSDHYFPYLEGALFSRLTVCENLTNIGTYFLYNSGCPVKELNLKNLTTWCNIEIADNQYQININSAYLNGEPLKSITTPESITELRQCVFYNFRNLEELIITDNINSIGKRAIYYCDSLNSVRMGRNVKSIYEDAFLGTAIKTLRLPDIESWFAISFNSHTSNPMYYSQAVYVADNEFTELVVPETISGIRSYSFAGCKTLKNIVFNNTERINKHAFYSCGALESIQIPETVTEIGEGAFKNCVNSKLVRIPSSVTTISKEAFMSCGGDATIECNIPNYTSYSTSPFYTNKFSSIIIGDSVTQIGDNSFQTSSSLETLYIGDSVTYIGTNAFYNSSKLHTVTIGKSVILISGRAFANTAIKTVYCKPTTPPELLDASLLMYGKENLKVYVPTESVELYKTAWQSYKDYIFGYNFE